LIGILILLQIKEVSLFWVLEEVLHMAGVVAASRSEDSTWTAFCTSELAQFVFV